MRKSLSMSLVAVAAIAGLSLSGCATKQYVQQQVQQSQKVTEAKVAEVQTSVEANQAEITKLHQTDAQLEGKISKLSGTAQEALDRAEAAGKLAKGKFLYEVTLSDNNVHFGFNKYDLSPEAKAALDQFANKIKAENANVYIEIQGHTDNIGSAKYNLKLGYERAEQVMRYLNMQHGFPLFRMNVISYGESKPIADNHTKEGRAKNRRVTLVVMQ
ncbi:MAG: OmpA family protein [Acidobacteria bacterium]|nr:OmpA family protein [Acidobacteriota bacterium]